MDSGGKEQNLSVSLYESLKWLFRVIFATNIAVDSSVSLRTKEERIRGLEKKHGDGCENSQYHDRVR